MVPTAPPRQPTPLSTVVKHVTYPDRTIVVTNTGASSAVQSGDTIQIENEQMTVTGVSGSGPWTLTVTRAVNGTTEATHAVGKIVYKIVPDTTVQVTNTGASSAVAIGDTIQVDNEQMLVSNVTAGAATVWNLTVTRAYHGTTEAAHALAAVVYDVAPDTTVQVTNTGGVEVAVNDLIQIDNEQMFVTNVTAGATNDWNLTVIRGYNNTTEAAHTPVGTAVFQASPDGPDDPGDKRRRDFVCAGRPNDPDRQRADARHRRLERHEPVDTHRRPRLRRDTGDDPRDERGCHVQVTLDGSATTPTPLEITANTTLQPGTYYGGICIGAAAGSNCSNGGGGGGCSAVGGTTTTETAYASGEILPAVLNNSDTTFNVSATTGSGTIAAGQYIEIDSEIMLVNTATSGTTQTLTVSRAQNDT